MRNQLSDIVAKARESGRSANQSAGNVLAAEAIRLARVAATIHLACASEQRGVNERAWEAAQRPFSCMFDPPQTGFSVEQAK